MPISDEPTCEILWREEFFCLFTFLRISEIYMTRAAIPLCNHVPVVTIKILAVAQNVFLAAQEWLGVDKELPRLLAAIQSLQTVH